MDLAGRLDLLKASDLDTFLDATLACLRLVQNILEHPHNERYRRLRRSAPILARPGVVNVMEAVGFRCEDTQMILPDALLQSKDTLQHLNHCKGEIIAARRSTGCKMGWEVPQNSIHLASVQGSGVYGEVYSGTMDGKEVSVKLLQHMKVKKLRDQFSREIEVLRQLCHSNVVELMGVVITVEPPSMVLESLLDSLLQELQDSTITTGLTIAYLNQVAEGMQYIHGRGYLHCKLSVACLYLDAYGTVKITDFSRAIREDAAEVEREDSCVSARSDGLESDFSVRWMAPEVITDQKWSRASDVWSFGVVLFEFITSGSLPYAKFTNEQVTKMVATGYQLPCPPTCSDAFRRLVMQCCAPSPSERPNFASLVTEYIPELEQSLTQPPTSPTPVIETTTAQFSLETSSEVSKDSRSLQRMSSKRVHRVKEPSLNSILNKGGDLIRVFTGMLSRSKPSVVVCCLPKTTAQDLISMALFKCGKHIVVDSKNCRVVLVAAEKKAPEEGARVVSAEQPIVAAKHSMGASCQVVLYNSRSLSSSLPPSDQEVLSAVMKARHDPSMMPAFELHLRGYLILNEEVESDGGKRQVVCRWRKLWCVIHLGTMFLYSSKKDEEVRGYWRSLSLNNCRLQVLYENKKKISGFSLHFPSGHDLMFSTDDNEGVEVCDWIEAINSGKHKDPSPLLKESSVGVVIHAGRLHFHQCLDVRKTKMTEIINKIHGHSQRETKTRNEDGVVEEGISWVTLRNNGVIEKVVLSEEQCEEGEGQSSTEEWINLSDVTSILFSDCATAGTSCIMEVHAPPSRIVLKAESSIERFQWINCFRRILAKSGQESIISNDLSTAHSEGPSRRRMACTSAKAVFRKPSVDVQSTYYIRPDEVNCFSSDESLEDSDPKQHGSGTPSIDSGMGSELRVQESCSYLQLLPSVATHDDSSKDPALTSPMQERLVFDLPTIPQCELPLYQESDEEGDLYCDIEDQRRMSLHIYDSISDYSKALELHCETIEENGKEEKDEVFNLGEDAPSVLALQEPGASPLILATTVDDDHTGTQDSTDGDLPQTVLDQYVDTASIIERKQLIAQQHISAEATETRCIDRLSPLPDSPAQCSDAEETVSQREHSPSPVHDVEAIQREMSPSPIQEDETSQRELSPSPIQEDETSQRALSPSPIQEDDYVPMKSAGLADDIQTFREGNMAVKLQMDWRNVSSLTPEQAQQQRQLSVAASHAPTPPPLPPRNGIKRTYSPLQRSGSVQRGGNRIHRCPSNSSVDSLDSESSYITNKGSFRNIRHLLGSFIHDSPPNGQPERMGERTEKRKMTVYKTAEILSLDGGIGLSGDQQFNSLRRKKKDDRVKTVGRSDATSPPLLLTMKGIRGTTRHRPALSNLFDTAAADSSSSLSCAEEDDEEPGLPPRTGSCGDRVNTASSGSPSVPRFEPIQRNRSQSCRLHRHVTNTISAPQHRIAMVTSPSNQTEGRQQSEDRTGEARMAGRDHNADPAANSLVASHEPAPNDASSSKQPKQLAEVVSSCSSEGAPADSGLKPEGELPPGWEKALDPERGVQYYFNPRTRDITWSWEEVLQLAKQCQLPPGEGWQAVDLLDGCRYFYHTVSQKTTWSITDTWAEGVARGVV